MLDIIEALESIGIEDVKTSYVLPEGIYVKVSKDSNKVFVFKEKNIENIDDYDFFKERMFFDGISSGSNSCVLQKIYKVNDEETISGKIVLSVTPYQFYINGAKLIKNTPNEFIAFFEGYYKDLCLRYEIESTYLDLFKNAILEFYEKNITLLSKTDKVVFSLPDVPIEKQKECYDKYLKTKMFMHDTAINIDGIEYGVSSFANSLNIKKPIGTFGDNLRPNSYLFTEKQAKVLLMINKIKDRTLKTLIDNKFSTDIKFDLSRTNMKINFFNSNKDNTKDKHKMTNYKIASSEEILQSSKDISRRELLFLIEKNITKYTMSKIFDMNDFDLKLLSLKEGIITPLIAKEIYENKQLFYNYFIKGTNVDISKQMFLLLKTIFEKSIKSDNYNIYNSKKYFDLTFNIMNYLEGDKKEMINKIGDIENKLSQYINSETKEEYQIENDEEFLFISGQVIFYLISQSKTSQKKNKLLITFNNIKNSDTLKSKINDLFNKYSYDFSIYSKINLIIASILKYRIEDKFIIKENNLWYFYNAGLIGKSYLYKIQKEKETEESA